ncbi:histone deacetylase domain-containing protein [Haematococcus lacustris]
MQAAPLYTAQVGQCQAGSWPAWPLLPPATLLVLAPEECCLHHTAPQPWARGSPDPPPENPHRLAVLTNPGSGVLHTLEFQALDWETRGLPDACLADLLRCHHWPYVRDMAAACAKIPLTSKELEAKLVGGRWGRGAGGKDSPAAIGLLDPDTAISHHTFAAALKAAGACCAAVDRIMTRKARRVFCAVRPPGHHAGPQGVVPNANDPHVSHGFCLFSNLAIAAAYAVNVYRHQGVRRVALLDFDVHHGNGTEAVVSGTQPSLTRVPLSTPYSEGEQCFPVCKPWLDPASDADNIFFASVQGYGPRPAGVGWFYPGSGMTDDSRPPPPHPPPCTPPLQPAASIQGSPPTPSALGAVTDATSPATCPTPCAPGAARAGAGVGAGADPGMASDRAPPAPAAADWVTEDPDNEFTCCSLDVGGERANATLPLPLPLPLLPAAPPLLGSRQPAGSQARGPRIINVGVPGPGAKRQLWRRAWRDKILPALVNFKPDMIFVSAGFDAHKKEDINMRFVGVEESDYEWLTDQIVQVANRCCGGRVVSALEGGYNIRGGHTSAFARSVGAHVRALAEAQHQHWDPLDAEMERQWEARRRESLGGSRTHTLASPLHPAASGSGGWGAQGLGQQGGDPAPTPPLQPAWGPTTSSGGRPAAGPQPADAAAAGVPTGHGAAGMAGAGAASALGQLTSTVGDGEVAAAAGAAGGGGGGGEGGEGAGLGAAAPAGQEGGTSPPAAAFSPRGPSEPLTGIKRRRRGSGGQVNYAELNAQLECARQL